MRSRRPCSAGARSPARAGTTEALADLDDAARPPTTGRRRLGWRCCSPPPWTAGSPAATSARRSRSATSWRAYRERPGPAGAIAHHARGELAAAIERGRAAAARTSPGGRLLEAHDDDPDLLPWRPAAALAAVRLGQRARAPRWPASTSPWSRPHGSPYAVALGAAHPRDRRRRRRPLALLRQARGDASTGLPAARLAAQIDTDLAGLLLLDARRERAGRGARAAARRRGRTPAARSSGRCRAGSAGCSTGSASSPGASAARRSPR